MIFQAERLGAEMGSRPRAEGFSLSHIEDFSLAAFHNVDPWRRGQALETLLEGGLGFCGLGALWLCLLSFKLFLCHSLKIAQKG